jgi:tartronate-semialdehyde synthase
MIRAAKAPVIVMGGGVVLADACGLCIEFAERMGIRVITTYMAKAAFPRTIRYNAGIAGIQCGQPIGNKGSSIPTGHRIGNRFTDRHTGRSGVPRRPKFIHINIEEGGTGKDLPRRPRDPFGRKGALLMLLEEASKLPAQAPRPGRRAAGAPCGAAAQNDYDICRSSPTRVRRDEPGIRDDVIYTTGCGITQIWSGQLQEVNRPRATALGGAGTLGYDIPRHSARWSRPGAKPRRSRSWGTSVSRSTSRSSRFAAKFGMPLIVATSTMPISA